jgi:SAM-dependent methyltransferase
MKRLLSLGRGLMEALLLRFYGIIGPRFFSSRYFEYRYRRRPDPWSYESSPYEQRKYQQTLEILPRAGYEQALEVGCSIGVFTEQLAQRNLARRIVGIDVARNALARAQERLERFPNVELHCRDITREPLTGSFDLIFCAEVLYYLGAQNLRVVRDKLVSALREDGHLVLVHAWPLSRLLHREFLKRPELQPLQERVEREAVRPYAITLLVKRS